MKTKINRIILISIVISILLLLLLLKNVSAQDIQEYELLSPQNISFLEEFYAIESIDDSIKSISFSADKRFLIIVTSRKILSLNIATQELESIADVEKDILISEVSRDGKLLSCICDNQSPIDNLVVMSLETKQELFSVVDLAPATDITIDKQNKYLITATGWSRQSSKIQVWDIEKQVLSFELPANGWTSKVAFSPNSLLMAGGFDSTAQIWDVNLQKEIFSIEQLHKLSEMGGVILKIGDITFSPDNKQVASMSPEGYVWIWDTSTGKLVALFTDARISFDNTQSSYSLSNTHLHYNLDGKLLATSNGQTFNIWDTFTKTLIYDMDIGLSDFLFSPDGRILATVSIDNKVALWGVGR